MPSPSPDFASFRLSTDELPERERMGYWREVIGRTILRLDVSGLPDQPFQSSLRGRALPELVILRGFAGGLKSQRTPELLADGNDDLLLPLPTTGGSAAFMSQLRRQAALGDGRTMLMSNADVGSVTFHKPVRYISLSFPRKALMPLVPRLEDTIMRPIPRDSAALRLLRGYVSILSRNPPPDTPQLRRLAVAHVHDLVALALGASRDAEAVALGRGVRAARLNAIKEDIAAHLGEQQLTVTAVAARQNVSPRYIQILFQDEGTTFSQYVLRRRLVRAYRILTDARCFSATITAIAIEAGFGDLSTFNHAFRRLYGASPSDVRANAQRHDRH